MPKSKTTARRLKISSPKKYPACLYRGTGASSYCARRRCGSAESRTDAVRFSQRTDWDTEESALARAHRLRVEAGLPIADLTASNPTRCGFEYDPGLVQALADPRGLDYDPQPRGAGHARQAVSAYYADHGVAIDPERIVLTTSTSEGYSFLFRLLCDPGSEILVPQPSYPLFDFLARLDDVRLKPAPLVYDHGWQIDPEVFLDYSFGEAGQSFAAGLEDVPVFVVSGLSKIAGLPQMKAAWIAAAGAQAAESLERLEVIADSFLSMNTPAQCALPSWLASRAAIQNQIRTRVAANLAQLDRQLVGLREVDRLNVEGGWYAVLRIPAIAPDERTVLALLDRGVWLHPGYFFGMPASGWLVVSLLPRGDEFAAGVDRLIEHFRGELC